MQYFADRLPAVEKALDDSFISAEPETKLIVESMKYSLMAGARAARNRIDASGPGSGAAQSLQKEFMAGAGAARSLQEVFMAGAGAARNRPYVLRGGTDAGRNRPHVLDARAGATRVLQTWTRRPTRCGPVHPS